MNNEKKIVLIIVSIILFWIIAPALTKDKIIGLITFASTERQCFNYHKEHSLKDPDSAYLSSSYNWTKPQEIGLRMNTSFDETSKEEEEKFFKLYPDSIFKKFDSVIYITVLAKNSFGGYVSNTLECGLTNEKFNSNDFFMYEVDEKLKRGERLS